MNPSILRKERMRQYISTYVECKSGSLFQTGATVYASPKATDNGVNREVFR